MCLLVCAAIISLLCLDLQRVKVTEASVPGLPAPAEMLAVSPAHGLPVLKGLRLDPENPLHIDFIVDTMDAKVVDREDSDRLVSYFLAVVTTPQEDLWVNLSPDEDDRILAEGLEMTQLGRDLLAQDYVLKQLASSLTHPDSTVGKAYWAGVGAIRESPLQADESKIWIVPDRAEVYESGTTAVITEASLKLQCEDEAQQVLLPAITSDVNVGKNFARLRQMYRAILLGLWFKEKFRQSFFDHYIDREKLSGIDTCDPAVKQKIFDLYVQSFKKGVYDVLRTENKNKRHFFSGGNDFSRFDISSAVTMVSVSRMRELLTSPETFKGSTAIIGVQLSGIPLGSSTLTARISRVAVVAALVLFAGCSGSKQFLRQDADAVPERQVMVVAESAPDTVPGTLTDIEYDIHDPASVMRAVEQYYDRGDVESAKSLLLAFLDKYPFNASAYQVLAYMHAVLHERKPAVEAMARALDLTDLVNDSAFTAVPEKFRGTVYPAAVLARQKVAPVSDSRDVSRPDTSDTVRTSGPPQYAEALRLMENGQWGLALDEFRKYVSGFDSMMTGMDDSVLYKMGECHENIGEYREAGRMYARYAERMPDNYEKAGVWEKAFDVWPNQSYYREAGMAYALSGEREKGLSMIAATYYGFMWQIGFFHYVDPPDFPGIDAHEWYDGKTKSELDGFRYDLFMRFESWRGGGNREFDGYYYYGMLAEWLDRKDLAVDFYELCLEYSGISNELYHELELLSRLRLSDIHKENADYLKAITVLVEIDIDSVKPSERFIVDERLYVLYMGAGNYRNAARKGVDASIDYMRNQNTAGALTLFREIYEKFPLDAYEFLQATDKINDADKQWLMESLESNAEETSGDGSSALNTVEPVGGIDLTDMATDIVSDASSVVALAPVDLGDFDGFSFRITRLQNPAGRPELHALAD